jgi:outer membrane protein insertion porin family
LSAQAQAQAGSPTIAVDSVHVTGNTRTAAAVILADLSVRPGDVITYVNIQRGIQRLFATKQFDDIRVYAVEDPEGFTTLIIDVLERPYITSYTFRGLEHAAAGAIRDTSGLLPNSPLNPAAIHEAEFHIKTQLADKGYVRASVDTALIPGDEPGEFRLVFDVDEGRRLVVTSIGFEGNEHLSDAELTGAMTVKPEGFMWWQTGEFREDAFQSDIEVNLIEFYGSNGYLDFQVLDDSMIVDPNTGKTRLIIQVEEGKQWRIAEFQVEGNEYYPTQLLEARFNPRSRSLMARLPLVGGGGGEPEGDPVFNTHAWAESTEEIRMLYRNAGFLYARVEDIVERLPPGEDSVPRVRLTWRVTENEQAYVNLVSISGNTTTHERVIRDRLSLLPADVYAEQRVISSYQSIQGLGFFEQLPPNEALDIRPEEETGNINVSFKVQEKQTGNINFGASLSPSAGLAGFIGYEQPNLFGQAKSGRFRWVFGSRTNDVEIGYTDPAIFGSRNSMGISLRNSRDRFSFVGLGRRRQTGGSITFGMPFLASRWTRISLGYSLFRDEYDSDDDELDLEQRQLLSIGTRSSVQLRVSRDTRNHPLFPSDGSRNMVSLEHTGGVLGGDGNYQKLSFESEWFTPVARLRSDPTQTPIDLVVGLGLRGGIVVGNNPFYLERFFMGGVQYGPPLRGYGELTITPASFGLNPTDLLRGFGVGASLVTPVGPLGIDYAFGVDRRDINGNPEPGWKLHFRFGQIF